MIKWLAGAAVLALIVIFAFIAMSRGIVVEVTNVGKEPITDLHVIVRGNEYELGDVEPGETVSVKVEPTGESDVRFRWVGSDGKSAVGRVECHIEAENYHGSVSADIDNRTMKNGKADVEPGFF